MARVLVVADDTAACEAAEQILRPAGHDVEFAATSADAWRALHATRADLVLCDLGLQDADGLSLLKRLLDAGIDQPFVLMTDAVSPTTAFEAGRLGVTAYIEKPIAAEPLLRIVRMHAGPHDPKRRAAAPASSSSAHIDLALRLIDERYGDPSFDIRTAATICGITREHLARVIRFGTRHTFTDLLRTKRMREARHLLSNTALRIKDIYQQIGLTSASEFDHAFKHMWQLSPKAYRLHCQRTTFLDGVSDH